MNLNDLKLKVLDNKPLSREEAMFLAEYPDLGALCDAADEISRRFMGTKVDSCSIVNARSGRCSEDCKWCAQASRHHTGCANYNFLDEAEVLKAAAHNEREGIRRFSLVTSGRNVSDKDLDKYCDIIRKLSDRTGLYVCASMGLLNHDQMVKLREAGVKRYHCNMETSSKVFPALCSTHTPDDKRATIRAAREAGLDVCSGGIIGMGETMEDRVDFAFELAALDDRLDLQVRLDQQRGSMALPRKHCRRSHPGIEFQPSDEDSCQDHSQSKEHRNHYLLAYRSGIGDEL